MFAKFGPGSSARKIRKAAMGGAALWCLLASGQAWAACAVTSGSGTVASPGANTTITCTNATTGLDVNSAASNVTVLVDSNAFVQGNAGDAVELTGDRAFVILNSLATVNDLSFNLGNSGATGPVLMALNGGTLTNNNAANTISLSGNSVRLVITDGGQLTTASTVSISGSNALFELSGGGRIVAAPNLTGPLVQGGSSNERFVLHGRMIGRDTGGTIAYLDAGDGDDTVVISSRTELTELNTAIPAASALSIKGGAGFDTLEGDGGFGDGQIRFSTTDFERLHLYGGANWQIEGSHAFQQIWIDQGVTLTAADFTSLGQATSTIDLRNGTGGAGRLVISDAGTHQFQHSLTGDGEIHFIGTGDYSFLTGSPQFNGTLINDMAVLRVSHSQAFGLASVINNGRLHLNDVSFGNRLSGSGHIIVSGTSSTITNGFNSIGGVVEVASGDLRIQDLRALGGGNTANPALVSIGANGRLVLDIGGGSFPDPLDPSQVFHNELNGPGTLVKQGTGAVVISRNNPSFFGETLIQSGWLHVGHQNALGTGTVTLAGGGLSLDDISFGNSLVGTGIVTKDGAGRTTMTGANQGLTATWTVNAGTLAGTSSGNFGGSGTLIYLGGVATLELTNATNQNLDLRISGSTGSIFRKLGGGRLTFIDTFTIGTLAVDAGSVRVNRAINANAVVGSAARLDGTGSITGSLVNNGTVAPGNSIGTLTINGNYTHNAGSVLEIEFDANGNIDLLAINGSAALNGGTLRFISVGGAEGNGGTFMTASGGITGTFATVDTVGALLPLAVIYQTNSAIMAPSVLTARPSTFNAQFLAGAETASGFADLTDSAIRRMPRGTRLWLDGFAGDGRRSASGQTLAYGHDSYGLGGGVTFQLGETTTLGLSAGWARGDIELGANGGGGKQSSVLGGITLRHDIGDAKLTGGVMLGKVDQDTVRNVTFNGFSATVRGETESTLYGATVGLDLPLGRIGKWSLGANLRGTWIRQDQDGYTEAGTSPLRLTLADLSADTLEGQAGLSIGRHFGPVGGGADFRVEFGGRVLGLSGDRLIPVSFAASSAAVVLQGDTRDSLHGYLGAALDIPVSRSAQLHIGYAGQFGTSDRHLGRIGFSLGF